MWKLDAICEGLYRVIKAYKNGAYVYQIIMVGTSRKLGTIVT